MHCYVLELEGDNYYVGLTSNLPRRIKEHFSGKGAQWTKIHPPRKVLSVISGDVNFLTEKAVTYSLTTAYVCVTRLVPGLGKQVSCS